MSIDALTALRAYSASGAQPGTGPSSATAGADAAAFGSMVNDAVKSAETTMRTAETLAAQGAAGQAPLVDVVTAISEAEVTLETVVAVRDQVIKAYQEILRMPI